VLVVSGFCFGGCAADSEKQNTVQSTASDQEFHDGTLFIIGGGARPESLMKKLYETVGDAEASAAVLTMASSEPDSAWWYLQRDLERAGFTNTWHFDTRFPVSVNTVDSLRSANLLFISGGDQSAFLKRADTLNVIRAIHEAFDNGAVIAGTSAGAAVMSKVMITGDQLKDSVYESTYSRLEANNAVYAEGLGLIDRAIIDQHFIERSRYNRMFTALHDFQGTPVIGIGESTALIVRGNEAEVAGTGQVVVGRLNGKTSVKNKDLLLFDDIHLIILGDGAQFKLIP
jgi:cyanophycinase